MSYITTCSACKSEIRVEDEEFIVCSGCGKIHKTIYYKKAELPIIANSTNQSREKNEITVLQDSNNDYNAPMTETQKGEIIRRFAMYLPNSETKRILITLKNAKQYMYPLCMTFQPKNPLITLLLSIYGGFFGLDRFYIGDTGLGVCKLLFGMLTFGLWPLIDIFISFKTCKKKNLTNLLRITNEKGY